MWESSLRLGSLTGQPSQVAVTPPPFPAAEEESQLLHVMWTSYCMTHIVEMSMWHIRHVQICRNYKQRFFQATGVPLLSPVCLSSQSLQWVPINGGWSPFVQIWEKYSHSLLDFFLSVNKTCLYGTSHVSSPERRFTNRDIFHLIIRRSFASVYIVLAIVSGTAASWLMAFSERCC